jgi:hypothetical protein
MHLIVAQFSPVSYHSPHLKFQYSLRFLKSARQSTYKRDTYARFTVAVEEQLVVIF